MTNARRLVVAVAVLVLHGLLIGTITEASQTPTAVDVEVDDVNHVITFTGHITLYPLCAPRVKASPSFRGTDGETMPTSPCEISESVRQYIQTNIEQIWNGHKYDCYDVVIKADVTVDNRGAPSDNSPDRLLVGLDQTATSFDSHTHGAPYQPGHTVSGNTPNDRLIPINSTDRPSRWAYPPIGEGGNWANVYAHEFGHVMGLDDSYEIGTNAKGKIKNLVPGHQPDLMFDSNDNKVDQTTIDRLVERTGKLSHATTKCDYMIDQMVDWYHFTSVKCDTPEGDWVLTLDGTHDIGGGVVYVLTGSGLITLTDSGTAVTGPWDAQYNTSVEGIPVSIGGQNGHLSGDAEFVKPNTLNLVTTNADADYYASNPYASRSGPAADPSRPITFTVINDHFC